MSALRNHVVRPNIQKARNPRRITRAEGEQHQKCDQEIQFRKSLSTREGLIAAGLLTPARKK